MNGYLDSHQGRLTKLKAKYQTYEELLQQSTATLKSLLVSDAGKRVSSSEAIVGQFVAVRDALEVERPSLMPLSIFLREWEAIFKIALAA